MRKAIATIASVTIAIACVVVLQAQAPTTSLQPPPNAPPIKDNPVGPYAVTIDSDPSLPTHTIYRPTDLKPFTGSKRLPLVSWGNGACANAGTIFQVFLTQVASHGYLVISTGPKDAPLPAWASGARPSTAASPSTASASSPGAIPAPASRDAQLIDAIDWAVKENDRQDSAYRNHLNTKKIAVMGQSCGGLQAIASSADPRIVTSVIWNSGTFPETGNTVGRSLSGARKESLSKFHAPVAYFIGGPTDVAYPNAEDDFQRIEGVPVFKGNINSGHGGTFRHPGAGWFGEVGVAWLNWQLKSDKQASRYFVGKDCTLCTNPIWTIEKKKIE